VYEADAARDAIIDNGAVTWTREKPFEH
jgi:hypothetical protein